MASTSGGQAYRGEKSGGINGQGGHENSEAGAGAGWLSAGEKVTAKGGATSGKSRAEGWVGGMPDSALSGGGGFGGGGGGHEDSAGGGGGFSGGAGSASYAGGGGGSFCYGKYSENCSEFQVRIYSFSMVIRELERPEIVLRLPYASHREL